MIKGHVQIDIHNHNSGLTERYEHDNMVTDALKHIVPMFIGANYTADKIMPLRLRTLGGLMLFDGPLTEDKSNILFPSEAHLVAFAKREANTDNTMCGSLNLAETKPIDKGYQSVWDFSTSQANGTIQSLALTSSRVFPFFGYDPDYSFHSVRTPEGVAVDYYQVLDYDEAEQTAYFIINQAPTSDYDSNRHIYIYHNAVTFAKQYVPVEKYKLCDYADDSGTPENVAEIKYDIEGNSSDPISVMVNGYDGYIYALYVDQNTQGDGKFTYVRISLKDHSFTADDPVSVSVRSCALYGNNAGIVLNGNAYLMGYNRRFIYIVNLADPVQVRTVDLGEGWTTDDYRPCITGNGVACLNIYKYKKGTSTIQQYDCMIYPDGLVVKNGAPWNEGTYQRSDDSRLYLPYRSNNLLQWGDHSLRARSYAHPARNYLGTICNLSSAVQKTAASSMKVTYTLTDVDEGSTT